MDTAGIYRRLGGTGETASVKPSRGAYVVRLQYNMVAPSMPSDDAGFTGYGTESDFLHNEANPQHPFWYSAKTPPVKWNAPGAAGWVETWFFWDNCDGQKWWFACGSSTDITPSQTGWKQALIPRQVALLERPIND